MPETCHGDGVRRTCLHESKSVLIRFEGHPLNFRPCKLEPGFFFTHTNRADSAANAVATEGNHGRLGKPGGLKSMGIHASDVRGRDKALRFPMGKMNRRHGKSEATDRWALNLLLLEIGALARSLSQSVYLQCSPVWFQSVPVQVHYMNLITIHFDGGCRPSNPGNKYGSFEVQLDMKQVCKISRMELGWGTNNEAEFEILIAALEWTVRELWHGGFAVSNYTLRMFTDSTIVANRIKNRNCSGTSSAAKRMAKLTRQVLAQLTLFHLWNIEWRRRDANVERFGH